MRVAAVVAVFVAACSAAGARAQNLIANPDFTNGFTDYSLNIGSGGNDFIGQFDNQAGALLDTGVLDAPATLSQTVATQPGATYLISFLGIFDPGDYTYTFGTGSLTLNGSTGCCTFGAPFTFTGVATGASTTLTFSAITGAEGFTQIDVQAAPAPAMGSGAMSFIVCLAALAGIKLRRFRRLKL